LVDVSVVIVNWNTCDLLRACLLSIQNTLPPSSYEIFVVDNASTDGSAEMVTREFPAVRLISNQENVGFGRANNQALLCAHGEYLVLLNPDTEVFPGTIARCVDFMASSPETAVVGGELVNPDGSLQVGYFDFPTFWYRVDCFLGRANRYYARWYRDYSPFPPVREVDWVSGSFIVVRRRAAEAVGLFDERFFIFAEETEWCYRFRKSGWKVHYLSEAKILHRHHQSTRKAPRMLQTHAIRGQLILFWTHYGKLEAALLTMLSLGAGLLSIGRGLLAVQAARPERRERIETGMKIVEFCFAVADDRRPQIPRLPKLG
jgi:GT2 family glycosyltransferase